MARSLGGGGHKAAAGFTSPDGIDATLAYVLPQLQAVLAAPDGEAPASRNLQMKLELGKGV